MASIGRGSAVTGTLMLVETDVTVGSRGSGVTSSTTCVLVGVGIDVLLGKTGTCVLVGTKTGSGVLVGTKIGTGVLVGTKTGTFVFVGTKTGSGVFVRVACGIGILVGSAVGDLLGSVPAVGKSSGVTLTGGIVSVMLNVSDDS